MTRSTVMIASYRASWGTTSLRLCALPCRGISCFSLPLLIIIYLLMSLCGTSAVAGQYRGALDPTASATFGGYRFDVLQFEVDKPGTYTVDLTSSDFDTYLSVISPQNEIYDNDVYEDTSRSLIRLQEPSSGVWHVIVTSYGPEAYDEYTVNVEATEGPFKQPPEAISDALKEQVFRGRDSRLQENARREEEQGAEERLARLSESLGLRTFRDQLRQQIEASLQSMGSEIEASRGRLDNLEERAKQLTVGNEDLAQSEQNHEQVEQLLREELESTTQEIEQILQQLTELVEQSAALEEARDQLEALERSSGELEAARVTRPLL